MRETRPQPTQGGVDSLVFSCFFVSGFCSLLYEVLWTRLAFAHFGIITPVLSLVVSVFMLGLGVGSAFGGRLAAAARGRLHFSPLYLYAAAEGIVAIGAFTVPRLFDRSTDLLLHVGAATSVAFLAISAACIVISLLPWCVAMGATFPLMMAFVKSAPSLSSSTSFSFLYVANVLGASAGAIATAVVLIELLGLRGTYTFAAAGNVLIAIIAVALAARMRITDREEPAPPEGSRVASERGPGWAAMVLFITGFSSVGLEVCWIRDFTFVLLTTIYAFALILAAYLISTYVGSRLYRIAVGRNADLSLDGVLMWLFPAALLPIILGDPRFDRSALLTLASIAPLCGALGFLTPGLVDRFGNGDATRAGRLYAVNIAGAIAGPLVAGYALLPTVGIRWAMILLAVPLLVPLLAAFRGSLGRRTLALGASAAFALMAVALSRAYDDASLYPAPVEVRRDYAAAVVAYGSGMSKQLLVNAIHITALTTDIKIMAHLPMALVPDAHNVLVICFGMGTTFRSLSTWGVNVTAVDLSPSVIESFKFFHNDAPEILSKPGNHTVADDGRRFLMRTNQKFDVITIDPPPPVEAAGSSLLYSEQFYEIIRERLTRNGVLAQWLPYTELPIAQSAALALHGAFPFVIVFKGRVGWHFIASATPVAIPSAAAFVARMPRAAQADLVEWVPGTTPEREAREILSTQVPFATLLPPAGANVPVLSDDRPYNEYFLVRRTFSGYSQI